MEFFIGVLIGIIMIPIGLLVLMIDTWMKSDDYIEYKKEREKDD